MDQKTFRGCGREGNEVSKSGDLVAFVTLLHFNGDVVGAVLLEFA